MQRDQLYLRDALDAADAIGRFIAGRDAGAFVGDDLVRSAVLHKLTIIGETAGRLGQELRTRHPEVPWQQLVAFRNILVHAYFSVDWSIVWETASRDVPLLRAQVSAILEREFPTRPSAQASSPSSPPPGVGS